MKNNPHFRHEERAPYEFCALLRMIPDLSGTGDISDDQHDRIAAADDHANSYLNTLLNGLESMGRALYSAASNKHSPLRLDDAAQIGSLVSELAMQLQFLNDFRDDVAGCNLQRAYKAGQK